MEQLRRERSDCYDPAIEAECTAMEDANPCEKCGSKDVEAFGTKHASWIVTCQKCGHESEYSASWREEAMVRY